MSQLIAIVYSDSDRAHDVLRATRGMAAGHLVDLDDAVVVTKDVDGAVRLHQSVNVTARGAIGGAFWGSLIGLLVLNPLIGLAAGVAAGAATGALTDYGISDRFMRDLASEMRPGTSAVFLLVRQATADRLHAELARYGGTVLHTSLSADDEASLRRLLADRAPSALAPPRAQHVVSLPPPQSSRRLLKIGSDMVFCAPWKLRWVETVCTAVEGMTMMTSLRRMKTFPRQLKASTLAGVVY